MTPKKLFQKIVVPLSIVSIAIVVSGCGIVNGTGSFSQLAAKQALGGGGAGGLGQAAPSSFSSSVPTADAIVGRIEKALPGVSPASGNFKTVLAQVEPNLPQDADPTKATGLEQIPLLVYGACSDVNPSMYSVNVNSSVSSQVANLVKAGVTMVNVHVANLASSGSANQQVSQVFSQLVQSDMSAGASTKQAFVSVCMAANSFGVGMTGF